MYVSLSERATAVHALETERIALFEAVAEIELKQHQHSRWHGENCKHKGAAKC